MQDDAETGADVNANEAQAVTPAPAPTAPTLDALKAQLRAELNKATPDDSEVMRLSKLILKNSSDVAKAEADKQKAEAEAMAGDREKLSILIGKAVKGVIDASALLKVKAKGFTFTIDHQEDDKGRLDPAGQVKVTGGCALIVPAIRKTGGGGGGGSTGALKQQTGLSRHELIDQFATEAEKAEVSKAFTDATSRPDSARYGAEKPVIKRILADNPQLIKR